MNKGEMTLRRREGEREGVDGDMCEDDEKE